MRKGTILGGVVAVTALVAANIAVAQERPTYELPAIEVTVMQTDLHQQAIDLYEIPERWGEAADLHREAAENLSSNDAGQFYGYSRAALLYFHAGELAEARRSMEDAAQVAEATGDVLTAAHAYVDAAFIAVRSNSVLCVTTRTSFHRLVLLVGRHSVISTVSPSFDSLFSSWTWQTVRRRRYLPYFGCRTSRPISTRRVFGVLSPVTTPISTFLGMFAFLGAPADRVR